MSQIESKFISRQEYDDFQPQRYRETDLIKNNEGNIYSAMFALNSVRALVFPARVYDVQHEDGLYTAKVTLIDRKMEPFATCDATIVEGYWVDVDEENLAFHDLESPLAVAYQPFEAYFKAFGEDAENIDSFIHEVIGATSVGRELVTV